MLHDAFISYSHADCGTIAPVIQNGLQTIGRPWYSINRNLNVFRDETNLSVTPELWPSIAAALDNSRYFILFASPIASRSGWVMDEIDYWIGKKENWDEERGVRNMFIVLASGTMLWNDDTRDFDWEATDCLPEASLSGKFKTNPYWIDVKPYVRESEKGRAIDHKAPGFVTAMTKIIGGITHTDPWKIESAELRSQRYAKRIRAFATILFFSLSVVIFILYRQAKSERAEAERQRNQAILNLKQFKLEEFNRNLRNGKIFIDAEENEFAKMLLDSALVTAQDTVFGQIPAIKSQLPVLKQLLNKSSKKY